MKKLVLSVATVLTVGLANAQECDVKVNVNEFTKEKTIETGFLNLGFGRYKLMKKNDNTSVYFAINSFTLLSIPAGEIIYLKLSNDTIIKFMNESRNIGSYNGLNQMYYNSFLFNIDEDQLSQLKDNRIVGIKAYINEYRVSENKGEKFKNNVNCIINQK